MHTERNELNVVLYLRVRVSFFFFELHERASVIIYLDLRWFLFGVSRQRRTRVSMRALHLFVLLN